MDVNVDGQLCGFPSGRRGDLPEPIVDLSVECCKEHRAEAGLAAIGGLLCFDFALTLHRANTGRAGGPGLRAPLRV